MRCPTCPRSSVPKSGDTRLTLGLAQSRLDGTGLLQAAQAQGGEARGRAGGYGPFPRGIRARRRPDRWASCSRARRTRPGDRRVEARYTPVDGAATAVGRLAELGSIGVELLLGDSTNAERPGFTGSGAPSSVRRSGRSSRPAAGGCGRLLCLQRPPGQQAIDVALETGRKVSLVGRSLRKNVDSRPRNLGYIDVPEELLVKPADLGELPPRKRSSSAPAARVSHFRP